MTDGATPEPLNSAANVFSVDADRYIAAAVAESTERVYATDERHFAANGIGIPATPAQVVEYLTKFAGKTRRSNAGSAAELLEQGSR